MFCIGVRRCQRGFCGRHKRRRPPAPTRQLSGAANTHMAATATAGQHAWGGRGRGRSDGGGRIAHWPPLLVVAALCPHNTHSLPFGRQRCMMHMGLVRKRARALRVCVAQGSFGSPSSQQQHQPHTLPRSLLPSPISPQNSAWRQAWACVLWGAPPSRAPTATVHWLARRKSRYHIVCVCVLFAAACGVFLSADEGFFGDKQSAPRFVAKKTDGRTTAVGFPPIHTLCFIYTRWACTARSALCPRVLCSPLPPQKKRFLLCLCLCLCVSCFLHGDGRRRTRKRTDVCVERRAYEQHWPFLLGGCFRARRACVFCLHHDDDGACVSTLQRILNREQTFLCAA